MLRTIGLVLVAAVLLASASKESFDEELAIAALPTRDSIAYNFRFDLTTASLNGTPPVNRLFPRVLADVARRYSLRSMSFSLAQGYYRAQQWGYMPQPATPHGARLRVVFDVDNNLASVDDRWRNLVHTLSGYFCASLVQVVPKYTTVSSIEAGDIDDRFHAERRAMLSSENICTENLTPFVKLLPCKKRGLVSLLNAEWLVSKAHHYALSVHMERLCNADQLCTYNNSMAYKTTLGVTIVHHENDYTRDIRLHVPSLCPLARSSNVHVRHVSYLQITPPPTSKHSTNVNDETVYSRYDLIADAERLMANGGFELHLRIKDYRSPLPLEPPQLTVHSYVAGSGVHNGRFVTELFNRNNASLNVVYSHLLPWFVRLYFSTVRILCDDSVNNRRDEIIMSQNLIGSIDRERPSLIEFAMRLPPNSECTLSVQFERAFLRWNEFPPDANKGFDVPSASISFINGHTDENGNCVRENESFTWDSIEEFIEANKSTCTRQITIYAEPLVVVMPTPDFSMPYNVLCLVCTVVALAFGPIHNLTTRRCGKAERLLNELLLSFSLRRDKKKSALRAYLDRLKMKFGFAPSEEIVVAGQQLTQAEEVKTTQLSHENNQQTSEREDDSSRPQSRSSGTVQSDTKRRRKTRRSEM